MSNSGGTLTLPSPTHPHHVDVSANLRSLRRSLSRSPSKFPLVRTASQSSSDAGSSPSSPSIRRVQSQFFGQNNSIHSPSGTQPHTQSPLATPFRPSVKLSLRSAKATKSPASSTSNKPFSRHRTSPRTSPKSPTRRVLTQASSSGNSIPSSNSSSSIESLPSGQENLNIFRTRSPAAPRKASEKAANRHSMHLDMSGSSQLGTSRFADASNGSASSMASPLKRSDASMSLDQSLGSPKAKRRSYGPSSLGADFNIFDHGPTSPGSGSVFDDSSREYDWTSSSTTNVAEPLTSLSTSAAMRRAGSLRKSTLQQRERTSWGKRYAAQQLSQNFGEVTTPKQRERTSWNRRQAAQQLATIPNETATPNAKSRPRLSLDQFVPPPPRDSPFNTQGPLPNPSAHTMVNQPAHQPHPLSRTMTTASTSTVADESPTQFPTPTVEKAKGPTNFSKSLPVGAVRPQAERPGQGAVSVSTPNYKNEKPFEGAFHSTGLISKMRYNPELGNVGGSHAVVPDTPCKGRRGTFATYPQPWSGGAKSRGRHIRHTFGVPSTPFDAQTPNRTANLFSEQPRPVAFGGFSNHSRKGSLLSLYSDDGRSPSQKHGEFEPTGDAYMPPTPTKTQPLFPGSSRKMQFSNGSPIFNRCLPAPLSAIRTDSIPQQELPTSCKYTPERSCNGREGKGNVVLTDDVSERPTPVVQETSPTVLVSLSSFSRSRARRGPSSAPAPLEVNSMVTIVKSPARVQCAKSNTVIPASPLERLEFAEKAPERASPHTPQSSMVPLDASRLSISNHADGLLFPGTGSRNSAIPPATPTSRHGNAPVFLERRAITPINGMAAQELDENLMSRFGKVESIGKGEFSMVYKVTETAQPARTLQNGFFSTPTHRSPSSSQSKVYAVKKLTLPIQGQKDRASRLREVFVLERLRGCSHILQLVNDWEDNNCLYIQTEYCEEGSLDKFLNYVGVRGRLDDFRIWKIMLEIAQVSADTMK